MSLGTFLNGRAATQLRGLQWLSFGDTAVIQSKTATSDSGGGATLSWANIGTAACRIYPVSTRGKSQLVGGQINEQSTHFCALPVGTDVQLADRLVIANRGTFEVTLSLERTDAFTQVIEVFQVS